jgi:NAD(P)H dehydrogenase (quinone)
VKSARETGEVHFHLTPLDRAIPIVAAGDIGRAAAAVITQQWNGTRIVEVAGIRDYSPLDIAQAFSSALGKPVQAVAVPREQWTESFLAQGMPAGRTEPRAEMVDGFNSGWIHFHVSGTEHHKGATELQEVVTRLVKTAR